MRQNRYHLLVILAALVAGCTQPTVVPQPVAIPSETIVSPRPTIPAETPYPPPPPTYPAPTGPEIGYPREGGISIWVMLTPSATFTLEPTPIPTFSSTQLSPPGVADMAVWEPVESGTSYAMVRISQTPLGVQSLDWSPDGRNLMLKLVAGPVVQDWPPVAQVVYNLARRKALSIGIDNGSPCSVTYAWSPDGRQLAYGDGQQLRLAAADGRNPLVLAENQDGLAFPAFSPNGRVLAAVAGRSDGQKIWRDLWILDVSSGKRLSTFPNIGLNTSVWSFSGEAVTVVGPAEPFGSVQTSILILAGNRTVSVAIGPYSGTEGCLPQPAWLVGGKRVLVADHFLYGIWVVDLDGKVTQVGLTVVNPTPAPQAVLAAPLPAGGICTKAAVSPDGRDMVYTTLNELHLLDMIIGRDLTLEKSGNFCQGPIPVTWSPAGRQFLLLYHTIELVDARDGSRQTLVTQGFDPAWSPDGKAVTFMKSEGDGYSLWMIGLNDRQEIRLTSPGFEDFNTRSGKVLFQYDSAPHWSPDGRFIAFVSARFGQPEVYLVQVGR